MTGASNGASQRFFRGGVKMAELAKYENFVDRVNELGFMPMSNLLEGLPSLTGETPKEIWHTGDRETDPWCWKDRAAEEKKLAFGCILGGHKGFIAPHMYAAFYNAFRPEEHMEERHEAGMISPVVWELWKLFETRTLLDTSDIRREMGVTQKKGGSKVDSAIKELQKKFYITVAGNRRKTDKFGEPYGWPANVYDKIENWVPGEWMKISGKLCPGAAKEIILERGAVIGNNINAKTLAKTLGF